MGRREERRLENRDWRLESRTKNQESRQIYAIVYFINCLLTTNYSILTFEVLCHSAQRSSVFQHTGIMS